MKAPFFLNTRYASTRVRILSLPGPLLLQTTSKLLSGNGRRLASARRKSTLDNLLLARFLSASLRAVVEASIPLTRVDLLAILSVKTPDPQPSSRTDFRTVLSWSSLSNSSSPSLPSRRTRSCLCSPKAHFLSQYSGVSVSLKLDLATIGLRISERIRRSQDSIRAAL